MGLFEKFKNKIESAELKRKKSHLKNLYSIALADGKLANLEFDFLLSVASKLYLNTDIVQNVIHFPDDIIFYVPQNDRERVDQIYDCVCMALVDGELKEREVATCKMIAVKLGFRPVIIDHMISEIVQGVLKGIASDVALAKLLDDL